MQDRLQQVDSMSTKLKFEEVYLNYYDKVYKSVYMRLLNRQTTEDLVQEIFIKAITAYENYDPELASVSTWLMKITTNTVIDYLRKEKAGRIISFDEFLEEGYQPGADDPELDRLTDDCSKEAYIILKSLKDKDRELLMLRYGMELSYAEIAERLGSNEKAVGKRMERLLKKCREL